MRRRKTMAAAAVGLVLVAGVGLTACGSSTADENSAPEASSSVPAAPAPDPATPDADYIEPTPEPDTSAEAPGSVRDEMYLQVVREEYPSLAAVDDDTLASFGRSVAEAYQAGAPLASIVATAFDAAGPAVPAEATAYMIGAGIQAFAPEMADQFNADLAELS